MVLYITKNKKGHTTHLVKSETSMRTLCGIPYQRDNGFLNIYTKPSKWEGNEEVTCGRCIIVSQRWGK